MLAVRAFLAAPVRQEELELTRRASGEERYLNSKDFCRFPIMKRFFANHMGGSPKSVVS
jgi:hypothetical protein